MLPLRNKTSQAMKHLTFAILILSSLTAVHGAAAPASLGALGDKSAPPVEPVACNPNGHTCSKKLLTKEVCAAQCVCNLETAKIECKKWKGCKGGTVEWNCACHSVELYPKGRCLGMTPDAQLYRDKVLNMTSWPEYMAPVKAHPWLLDEYS